MSVVTTSPRAVLARKAARFSSRVAVLYVAVLTAMPAAAQQMVGQKLLTYARNYIIGPIGIFAVVAALGASIFRPDLAKGAIYTAIICAVLFFIIGNASTLLTAMQ